MTFTHILRMALQRLFAAGILAALLLLFLGVTDPTSYYATCLSAGAVTFFISLGLDLRGEES